MNFSTIKPSTSAIFTSGQFSGIFDGGFSTYLRFNAPMFNYDGWSALSITAFGGVGSDFLVLLFLSGISPNETTYAQNMSLACNGYTNQAIFYNGVTPVQTANAPILINAATSAAIELQLPTVNVRETLAGAVGGTRILNPLKYWTLGTYSSGGVPYTVEYLSITAIY